MSELKVDFDPWNAPEFLARVAELRTLGKSDFDALSQAAEEIYPVTYDPQATYH